MNNRKNLTPNSSTAPASAAAPASRAKFSPRAQRIVLIISCLLCVVGIVSLVIALVGRPSAQLASLPVPEISSGLLGQQFGVDKNINVSTIDNYLGRSDSVYRDLRMLIDPGDYAAIGGDSALSGYVEGFEVIPLPYIVNVDDLPEAVGQTYSGTTLYTKNSDGTYTPNYTESYTILADIFPEDKNIFLMCGGGGYAGAMKDLLIALGWDQNRIYNVGGFWEYSGDHKVELAYQTPDGQTAYKFWQIPYHEIDFSQLHQITSESNSNQE